MPINPDAVGATRPGRGLVGLEGRAALRRRHRCRHERAGLHDREHQRGRPAGLPTFAVVIGWGREMMSQIGTFNPASSCTGSRRSRSTGRSWSRARRR